jgi:hypothetical protein
MINMALFLGKAGQYEGVFELMNLPEKIKSSARRKMECVYFADRQREIFVGSLIV